MIAKIRQINLEELFKKLKALGYKVFVKRIEWHYGIFEHQICKVHERLIFILDVENDNGSDVTHALDVANVRAVHSKSSENFLYRVMIFHSFLEQSQIRESSPNILLD